MWDVFSEWGAKVCLIFMQQCSNVNLTNLCMFVPADEWGGEKKLTES